MDNITKDTVFLKLKGYLADILGESVISFLDISMKSRFVQDLEMDSIQIVSFSEMVKNSYKLDTKFTTWLSKQSTKKLISLTIGDVVNFIVEHQEK